MMDPTRAIECVRPAIQQMVRITFNDIDHLSASNLALTMLALLEYEARRPGQNLQRLYDKLVQKQLPNGSWNDELWATGLSLFAEARLLEQQGRQLNLRTTFVRKAIDYVSSTKIDTRFNWQGEFLETVLLCWILPRIGLRREDEFVRGALRRLLEMQSAEGRLFDLYDTALAMLGFEGGATVLGLDTGDAIDRGVGWLKRWPPSEENVWSRSVVLYVAAEIELEDSGWAVPIAESLLSDFHAGVISDDHDEQAMAVLALCAFLTKRHPTEMAAQRVPVDNLVRILQYEEFLRASRSAISAKLEAANAAGDVGIRVFTYTDAFVKSKDDLFASIDESDQFPAVVTAFYKLFYEGSGNAGRIPKDLLTDDSIIFKIKHLRTATQHDIQHGDAGKIAQKQRLIDGIYREACGRVRPCERDEYRLVQVFLLSEMDVFLARLTQLITSSTLKPDDR